MARPIEATPAIRGKEARDLIIELDKPIVITALKKAKWDLFHKLYLDMMKRKVKHGTIKSKTNRDKQKPKGKT